ncbi:hypothetical protein ABTB76_19360, partial [Acinetobacter baumannii]
RMSWTSAVARAAWEPHLQAARTALEDLAVLRTAADGVPRIAFVRPSALARLTALADEAGTSLVSLGPGGTTPYDVATGRAARLVLAVGAA